MELGAGCPLGGAGHLFCDPRTIQHQVLASPALRSGRGVDLWGNGCCPCLQRRLSSPGGYNHGLTYGGTVAVLVYRYVRVFSSSQRQQAKWLLFGFGGLIVMVTLYDL